jgi:rod shape-determining protein MreD
VKTFYLILAILFFLFMQIAVADWLSLGPVAPDFLVLIVVFFSLYRGAMRGSIFGFVVGFLQDLANPGFLGLNAMTKTVLGYAVGKVGTKTFPENAPFLFVLFSSVAFAHDVVYLVFFSWPDVASAFLLMLTSALPSAIYTGVFGVIVHRLLTTLGAKVVSAIGKEGQ